MPPIDKSTNAGLDPYRWQKARRAAERLVRQEERDAASGQKALFSSKLEEIANESTQKPPENPSQALPTYGNPVTINHVYAEPLIPPATTIDISNIVNTGIMKSGRGINYSTKRPSYTSGLQALDLELKSLYGEQAYRVKKEEFRDMNGLRSWTRTIVDETGKPYMRLTLKHAGQAEWGDSHGSKRQVFQIYLNSTDKSKEDTEKARLANHLVSKTF